MKILIPRFQACHCISILLLDQHYQLVKKTSGTPTLFQYFKYLGEAKKGKTQTNSETSTVVFLGYC